MRCLLTTRTLSLITLVIFQVFAAASVSAQVTLDATPVGGIRQVGPTASFQLEFEYPVVANSNDVDITSSPAQAFPVNLTNPMESHLEFQTTSHRALAPAGLGIGGLGGKWTLEFMMRSSVSSVGAGGARTVISYAVSSPYLSPSAEANDLYLTMAGDLVFRGQLALSGQPLVGGRWVHVAIVGNNTGSTTQLQLYYDGVLQAATSRSGWLTPGGYFVLGEDQDAMGGSFDSSQAFLGKVDEMRIWGMPRSQAQIEENAFRTIDPATSGLVHYWKFDAVADLGVGTPGVNDIPDLVGSNHFSLENGLAANGTGAPSFSYELSADVSGAVGATTLRVTPTGTVDDVFDQSQPIAPSSVLVDLVVLPQPAALVVEQQGQPTTGTSALRSLRFDQVIEGLETSDLAVTSATLPGTTVDVRGTAFGESVDLLCPPGGSTGPSYLFESAYQLPPGDFTVECWCRPARPESAIVSFASNTPNSFLMLADGVVVVDNSLVLPAIDLGQNDGRWHHFRVSVEANRVTRWIDGVFAGAAEGETMTSSRVGYLVLGQDQDSIGGNFQAIQALDGPMDELRVHDTATPAVAWDEAASASTPGLWAHYTFEEFIGTLAIEDLAGSQNLNGVCCSITDGPDRGRFWHVELNFPDERTNYAEIDFASAIQDELGRPVNFDPNERVLNHVQVEDMIMSVEVAGGEREFHRASSAAGDPLLFRLESPGGRFVATGVPVILAQFLTTGTEPGSVSSFPELRLDLGLSIATVYDGAVSGLFGPSLLPPGGFPLLATNPGGLSGVSVSLQGLVSNGPNTVNGIFAVANVLVVDL